MSVAYVFCHGLNGNGRYDKKYDKKPYWGGKSGDVVATLRDLGYDAYAASVAPQGSAWDRACELYAQIAGAKADYGAAHSRAYNHERFGRDFSGDPLIPMWDEDTRLVLIGHSFGGVTVRLLAELLANGSEAERAAVPEGDLSQLFAGGMGERVRAIVTLAAPSNGTTAYDMAADANFDTKQVKVPLKYKTMDRLVRSKTKIKRDGRDPRDWADFDMFIDNAQAINAKISVLPHVYYFSMACDVTMPGEGDVRMPDSAVIEPLFFKSALLMGCYSGTTKGGRLINDEWHANDGMVNAVSARAPFGDPQQPFERVNVAKGTWNVMPDMRANHSFFQGGYFKRQDPLPFFQDLVKLIASLD